MGWGRACFEGWCAEGVKRVVWRVVSSIGCCAWFRPMRCLSIRVLNGTGSAFRVTFTEPAVGLFLKTVYVHEYAGRHEGLSSPRRGSRFVCSGLHGQFAMPNIDAQAVPGCFRGVIARLPDIGWCCFGCLSVGVLASRKSSKRAVPSKYIDPRGRREG